MSLASHKTYGPKGIGALYVCRKPRVRLEAQMHGGGHERGMRSGTLPTHQIVGMGEAFRIAKAEMAQDNAKARALQKRLLDGLKDVEQVFINGNLEHRVPHNLNMSFNFVEGESLIMGIKGLAVSSGSACTSASLEPSYVLRALGRSDELAHSSLRMTIGRFTTEEEIDYAITTIKQNVAQAARAQPAVGDVPGRDRHLDHPVDRSLRVTSFRADPESRRKPWPIPKKSLITTKTPATSAPSKRATNPSAPAWSARPPAATS